MFLPVLLWEPYKVEATGGDFTVPRGLPKGSELLVLIKAACAWNQGVRIEDGVLYLPRPRKRDDDHGQAP